MGQNLNWIVLLPPIIAIILALITKEVISSLLVGIVSGCLIYTNFQFIESLELMFKIITSKMSENIYIIVFLGILGAIMVNVTKSGGAIAYGEWVNKKIKTKKGAQIATTFLAWMFFIDDYFNCLTVGAVMGPVMDKNKVSRAKLAYITDSTAAPICIIAPISSWAAVVISNLKSSGVSNPLNVFIKTIPYNFYALFTIIMVWTIIISKIDFGPMAKIEKNLKLKIEDNINNNENFDNQQKSKSKMDLIIPIIALIIFCILALLYKGGFFSGQGISFVEAFKNTDSQVALTYGGSIALLVAFVMTVFTKHIKFNDFMDGIVDGIKSMVSASVVLILAWTIGGVCEKIGTGEYTQYIIKTANIPMWILPATIFIISAFLSFSTGTAWGTFGILIPVVVGMSEGMPEKFLIIFLSATLAGSAYGNHASPISDTTILSSTGAGCKHIDHVSSQLPYATIVAVISCLCYVLCSFSNYVYTAYILGVVCILIIVLSSKNWSKNFVRS